MTKKLSELSDELAEQYGHVTVLQDCLKTGDRINIEYDFGQGFDAAVAELLPVIISLLPYLSDSIQCGENHHSANMLKEKLYLKELQQEFGIEGDIKVSENVEDILFQKSKRIKW